MKRLVIPLIVALAALGGIILGMPFAATATGPAAEPERVDPAAGPELRPPLEPAQIGAQAESEVQISPSTGGRLPSIALSTNGSYVAVAYFRESDKKILLRSTDGQTTGWIPTAVEVGTGETPALAFSDPNTVHVAWVTTNQKIQHAVCDLTPTAASCGAPFTLNPANVNPIGSPAIVYDSAGGGSLHAAWIDTTLDQVITARTNSSNNWNNWTFSFVNGTNMVAADDTPVALAAAGGTVHLAFVDTNRTKIQYRKTAAGGHSWSAAVEFGPDTPTYDEVTYPTLAAGGANVYLAWDSIEQDDDTQYALMGIASTNSGSSWADGGVPRYITSTILQSDPTEEASRLTKDRDQLPPKEEAGLRPSLAVTGTNNFVIAWQQRPDSTCSTDIGGNPTKNGTSDIFFAEAAKPGSPVTGWWKDKVEALGVTKQGNSWYYEIDPGIVVNTSTAARHLVYMKATVTQATCGGGGGLNDYTIFYRGPFSLVQTPPDPPPPPPGDGGIFLPIITKNS